MGVLRRRGSAVRLRLWSFAAGFFRAAALALLLAQWGAWRAARGPGHDPLPSRKAPRWPRPRPSLTEETRGTETQHLEEEAQGATGTVGVSAWLGLGTGATGSRALSLKDPHRELQDGDKDPLPSGSGSVEEATGAPAPATAAPAAASVLQMCSAGQMRPTGEPLHWHPFCCCNSDEPSPSPPPPPVEPPCVPPLEPSRRLCVPQVYPGVPRVCAGVPPVLYPMLYPCCTRGCALGVPWVCPGCVGSRGPGAWTCSSAATSRRSSSSSTCSSTPSTRCGPRTSGTWCWSWTRGRPWRSTSCPPGCRYAAALPPGHSTATPNASLSAVAQSPCPVRIPTVNLQSQAVTREASPSPSSGRGVCLRGPSPALQCRCTHEQNYLQIPGKILQQWSYAWADRLHHRALCGHHRRRRRCSRSRCVVAPATVQYSTELYSNK